MSNIHLRLTEALEATITSMNNALTWSTEQYAVIVMYCIIDFTYSIFSFAMQISFIDLYKSCYLNNLWFGILNICQNLNAIQYSIHREIQHVIITYHEHSAVNLWIDKANWTKPWIWSNWACLSIFQSKNFINEE